MKTETNSMRIVKPEKESEKAVVEPQKEKATGKPKYKPVEPVTLETVPEDAVFIRSTDVCKLLNISNSTLRNSGARNPILQTGWDISLQQRRNHELPRIQLQ